MKLETSKILQKDVLPIAPYKVCEWGRDNVIFSLVPLGETNTRPFLLDRHYNLRTVY